MKTTIRIALLLTMLFAQSVWALSAIEFMRLKATEQLDVVHPLVIGFLAAGYKKIPDNDFALIRKMEKIILEKGYTYQNVEEVAKEAAIGLGMIRNF